MRSFCVGGTLLICLSMVALLAVGIVGCGYGPESAEAQPIDTPGSSENSTSGSPSGDSGTATEVLINSSDQIAARTAEQFGLVVTLDLEDSIRYSVNGQLTSPDESDIYEIGAVEPGDRLIVEVESVDETLDPAVAIFDGDQDSMYINDDRHYYNGERDSYIEFTSHRSSDRCYVAVSSSPRSDTAGEYMLYITREREEAPADPESQVVYLNFAGADSVVIGRRPSVVVPPFSGAMIDDSFSDDTDELIEKTVARMREDYRGYNVKILSSHEEDPPSYTHTTLHFGSYDPLLLGVADSVDAYNERKSQQAIIFVDTFAAFMVLDPSVDEMAGALANVASHEFGHLLGLHHTSDPTAIMDVTASLRQLLVAQSFVRAPLAEDTFNTGYQNSPYSLIESVGGTESVAKAALLLRLKSYRDPWYDQGPAIPARNGMVFGSECLLSQQHDHEH